MTVSDIYDEEERRVKPPFLGNTAKLAKKLLKENKFMPAKKRSSADNIVLARPKFSKELPGKRFEKSSKFFKILSEVKRAKGQWGQIAEFETASQAATLVQQLKKGNLELPEGKWDFASRTLDDDRGGVFAKYLGA